jgi:hypothetical protein
MSPSLTSTAAVSEAIPPASRLCTLPPWPWMPDDPKAPRTLGFQVANWIEGRAGYPGLIQPNGPRAGKKVRLTAGQLRFLLWWYALDELTQWLFMHAVRRLAKGSGKSPFAAMVALAEFCGPVRLDHFDDRVLGGCKGKPVDMPLVQIAATAESQTANTMRMVRALAPKGSPVVEAYGLDPGKTRYYKQPEGTLEIITSSATAAEGAESSFIIGDEREHWKPSNGGPELSATLEDNLAKSGARSMGTENAWVPGQETVAEATYDAWIAQEEGRVVADAGRILYDARIASPETDMADYESLKTALEFVYADCDWKRLPDGTIDVRPIMARIWRTDSKPDDSRRKYLNQPTAAEDAWTTREAWASIADVRKLGAPRAVDVDEDIVMFFDGSKSRDATALVGCCISDGHVFTIGIWEPNPAHDTDDVVDVADVDRVVRLAAIGAFGNVVGFFGDVQEWESFVKIEWPPLFPDLWVKAVKDGKDPQSIAWDMRSHTMDFTRAAELVEAELLDQKFTHDDHPVLARHVGNMRRRPNRHGISVGKESRSSARKIDAGVCMIGARMVRVLALASRPKKRTGKASFL